MRIKWDDTYKVHIIVLEQTAHSLWVNCLTITIISNNFTVFLWPAIFLSSLLFPSFVLDISLILSFPFVSFPILLTAVLCALSGWTAVWGPQNRCYCPFCCVIHLPSDREELQSCIQHGQTPVLCVTTARQTLALSHAAAHDQQALKDSEGSKKGTWEDNLSIPLSKSGYSSIYNEAEIDIGRFHHSLRSEESLTSGCFFLPDN